MNVSDCLGKWIADPVLFVRHVFKAEPDEWQKDVLRAFPTHQRIGMRSCKGPGKTTLLSWIDWHFLATRPYPKVAVTSITSDNLTDNLWSELAKWYGRSEFLQATFDLGKTRITSKEKPMEWYCSAKTWSKDADQTQQSLTLAGFHGDYVLFILDEVGGIPDSVMASAEAALSTGKETKIVMAGNPTHLEGPLWKACNEEADLWHMTAITGDPDDPKRSPRVSEKWAREQIAKYGRENPWVKVNVFGEFPPQSMNSLLGPDDVAAAMKRHIREDGYSFSQKRLGIDVARFGGDSTIIFPRQGLAAFHPVEMKGARTHEIAARVAKAKAEWGSEMEMIDSTGGWGAGVEDALIQSGVSAIPVHFSGKATDSRYFNKRSEMWFLMAEWVKKGGALPPIDQLAKELTTPTYSFHNGKLRLEEKDQIKQRLGFSPDLADALALSFAIPDQPGEDGPMILGVKAKPGTVRHEYDPFSDSWLDIQGGSVVKSP